MAWKMSGQDVEQGCLACAVGADQAIDSARLEGIAEILDGAQRTERNADSVALQGEAVHDGLPSPGARGASDAVLGAGWDVGAARWARRKRV
ncbi:hypothetical protein G6F65_023448 [Rhizopus arrhizus]|nr:hypothetical protein G6F65_023448 [Rhizopus arrhizus]